MKKITEKTGKPEGTETAVYDPNFEKKQERKKKGKQGLKEERLFRKEVKKVNRFKTIADENHYVHNALRMRKGRKRDLIIMFAATIKTIKGKTDMPTGEADYLLKSQNMYQAQLDNTLGYFTPAFAELSDWLNGNTAWVAANKAISKGTPGAEGLKTTAMNDVKATLKLFIAFINKLALLNQANAVSIITAALCVVIEPGKKFKQDFVVTQLAASGCIGLVSIAGTFDGKRVITIYEWAFSIDDGTTWEPLNPTLQAKTIAIEMGVGIETIFRKRTTTTKGGTSAWVVSEPITPK